MSDRRSNRIQAQERHTDKNHQRYDKARQINALFYKGLKSFMVPVGEADLIKCFSLFFHASLLFKYLLPCLGALYSILIQCLDLFRIRNNDVSVVFFLNKYLLRSLSGHIRKTDML